MDLELALGHLSMNRSHTTWAARLCWALRLSKGLLLASITTTAIAQITSEVVWQRCIGGSELDHGFDLYPTSDGGFICVGQGFSTDGDLTGSHGSPDILATKLNADGTVQWMRVLGGSSGENGITCLEASDGSIMIVGHSASNDGDVSGNHGAADLWVLQLSPQGSTVWQRCYGGSNNEFNGEIQETADGGFVIQCSTYSDDGDVLGFHPGTGTGDVWVFKINSAGILQWSQALGGSGDEVGSSGTNYSGELIQTADGGFLAGFRYTESNDGDVTNYQGGGDCWLVKLSASGAIEWSRTVGGSQREFGADILELSNGDLMLLGSTSSSDGDISLNRGGSDVLLAKISSTGQLLWERTYGGSLYDNGRSLLPTTDGGFILACSSGSSDGDVSSNAGEHDVWVLKVDANGSLLWQRSFGGSLNDWWLLCEADNGGYLLSGATNSNDGSVQGNNGGSDLWFLKLTENGDLAWQHCLGGSAEDGGYLRARTSDGGYVAFGYTASNDGDVSGNHGDRDMWVVKLKVTEPIEPLECALYVPNAFSPNASGKNDSQCLYGTECIKSMSFGIYDRWGNKVFESTDPKACWDGTYNGQALDPAVFVYHLSAALTNGETVEKQGNITLVR